MKAALKFIIRNESESRLRTGWRILLTVAGALIIFLPVQALLKVVIPKGLTRDQKIDILLIVFGIFATIFISVARILIDKRSLASLGLTKKKGMFRDVVAGYAISAVLVIIILTVEISFGWVRFEFVQLPWSAMISKTLYMFIVSGLVASWWENLFFVSYLFVNLRDGCGFWCAFILNCLISGLVHGANPNASILAVAGIVLIHSYEIFGFLRTKDLWLILGVHAGWNFFQGLAGFAVSGRTGNQVINQINNTPVWLGGGQFGPEAGLLIILTAIVAYSLIHLYGKWSAGRTSPKQFS